ncbi:MAG: DNA-3-methyladenine glycosylase I [Bacteroidales bacterium]|nr:DNA-3-methyladenine glycosylase I [Bacteroidales bacterium]MCF8334497.1 DNA-3-methyladenine glycosylase I [Bacteroidales bacterium]
MKNHNNTQQKVPRCDWVTDDTLYIEYHDNEWGVPEYSDDRLFEFLVLETFQAGLSWLTILKKRENFRRAFDNFDYRKIADYSDAKVEELLTDKSIIRNKRKILATIANAQAFIEVQKEFGSFSHYIWEFVNHQPIQNAWKSQQEVPANTPLSDKISKDLKKRGFRFVGTTVIYAHMQATGMVNDHTVDCFRYEEVRRV